MKEQLLKNCDAVIAEFQNLKAALQGAQLVPEAMPTMLAKLEERAVADLRLLQMLLVLKPC